MGTVVAVVVVVAFAAFLVRQYRRSQVWKSDKVLNPPPNKGAGFKDVDKS
jgi:hypothetical protein